jgi:hypothetical protein
MLTNILMLLEHSSVLLTFLAKYARVFVFGLFRKTNRFAFFTGKRDEVKGLYH